MSNYLIRGEEYLKRFPNFRLIGRQQELADASAILMRKKSNSLLLVGPAGVGATSILLGLQAMKKDPNAPFDIISKRFFWLDTNGLFSSGDSAEINKMFQRIVEQLWKTPNDVLIIKDTKTFIESSQSSGNSHFFNALTNCVRNERTQVILEVREEDLGYVLKHHADIRENYTLMEVKEPRGTELDEIVAGAIEGLVKYHGVKVSDEARKVAIELTSKYVSDKLREAQPARSVTVIDRALARYCQDAHRNPPHIRALEAELAKATDAETTSRLVSALETARAEWDATQKELRRLYNEIRDGETQIQEWEDRIVELEAEEQKKSAEARAAEAKTRGFGAVGDYLTGAGNDTAEMADLRGRIKKLQPLVDAERKKFDELTAKINSTLLLDKDYVMAEFSRITKIDVSELNKNEMDVLRTLEDTLKGAIFGQDFAVSKVSNGIKVAKVGGRNEGRPLGSFMFLGPSGVGKTELAKQLAKALGLELLVLNMADFQEKHSVATLIGAPPGYDGYEDGGILTNAARRNRKLLVLFDEIEKGHKDVYDVCLALLDNGVLKDRRGLDAFFDEAVCCFTTNLGQPHFLNEELSFEEATRLAIADVDAHFRPEFLNRFEGRENIIAFNRLYAEHVERIVFKEMRKVSDAYIKRGITSVVDDVTVKEFVKDQYVPKVGARGLPAIIRTKLDPVIVDQILNGKTGEFTIRYDTVTKSFDPVFKEAA